MVAHDAAAAAGFFLPINLGAPCSCQIVGITANNDRCVLVIRHGMTQDNLLGFEVVPADETVVSTLGKLRGQPVRTMSTTASTNIRGLGTV
jgi:FAD/FMN-containing dehydrogenase